MDILDSPLGVTVVSKLPNVWDPTADNKQIDVL